MKLTACSVTDTTTERLRKLLPKGYYVFTELAAKNALEAKINADAYQRKLTIAESALQNTSTELLTRTIERDLFKNTVSEKDSIIIKTNRKLIVLKIVSYVEATVIVFLTFKSLTP